LASLIASGTAHVVGVADPGAEARREAARLAPEADVVVGLEELLALEPDGVVIATPSALHAEQAIAILGLGAAVYCQKPLARTGAETRRVLAAARAADRPLGVDLCYRHTDAVGGLRLALAGDGIGRVHSVDLAFHNAYGPDKAWFTQRELSGGGCLVDLGTHLVDLGLWLTASTRAEIVSARVLAGGEPVDPDGSAVEEFATAEIDTDAGVRMRLACSWFLSAGRDCVFECTLYGTTGAVTMGNLDGSFYDFVAERWVGTRTERLSAPGEDWGARGITRWAARVADGTGFDADRARGLELVADVLDRIYDAAR